MKVKINIYVEEEIKEMLKEYADKNYTTVSGAITQLILKEQKEDIDR